MQIAVLGGGNGSFAAAGDLTMAGHEVRLWRRDAQAIAAHREGGRRILVKDFKGRHDVVVAHVTDDMAEAVRGAELILCPAPATAQADIAKALAPHFIDGQVVFLPPATFGSMLFATAARDAGHRAAVAFAETGTLPWLTRKHGPFEVAITVRAKRLPTGVFPLTSDEDAVTFRRTKSGCVYRLSICGSPSTEPETITYPGPPGRNVHVPALPQSAGVS